MERYDISTLKSGEELTEFYLVRAISVKTGSNGKQYGDFLFGDATGDITGKKWDVSPDDEIMLNLINAGDVAKVQGKIKEFNGQLQLTVTNIRKAKEEDPIEMGQLVKSAPESSEEMYDYIYAIAESFKDQDYRKICTSLLATDKEKLLYYPAAQRNHHAEMGGLLYHIKRMLMTGDKICEVYSNLNRDLVLTGVIIHDIEKLREIDSNEYGVSPGYSFEGQLIGHIVQGIVVMDNLGEELNIPREKIVLMQHMILSHHYEPDFGSPKKPMFPEAEVLHYLDMMDSKLFDMEEALASTEPGEFTGKVWTLDNRRLYKPTSGGK
ncbi:MAG: OB-fold nucleic acid binding domain-containing protein [Anaerovoracaceae bacterium]|jgi:3'-5' exoribonuclease|nr:OB-fold nucleic acid binding domain-containing protein [Anaerovoracaceae bacterium]